jgi:hypothetical protein
MRCLTISSALSASCVAASPALQWRMPELTRQRVNDRRVTWHVRYGRRWPLVIHEHGPAFD